MTGGALNPLDRDKSSLRRGGINLPSSVGRRFARRDQHQRAHRGKASKLSDPSVIFDAPAVHIAGTIGGGAGSAI